MLTSYEMYMKLTSDYERMRFYFKHSIAYKSKKVTKAKCGVYVKGILNKEYAEIDKNIILLYPVENGKIGQCSGEIVLDDFVENMKRIHDLLKN